MSGFIDDKGWSDQFIPAIKGILGRYLIQTAPFIEDAKHNTDLIVMTLNAVRIACRVRRLSYLNRFRYDFTMRACRPSGAKSEIEKIREGWGDYFFYAFGDKGKITQYFLGDLDVFRNMYPRLKKQERQNADGSSDFMVFSIEDKELKHFVVDHNVPGYLPFWPDAWVGIDDQPKGPRPVVFQA